MATIAAYHDAPNDEEDAHGEQQVNPTGSFVHQGANGPDYEQRDTSKNSEIHSECVTFAPLSQS